ncbi:GNAT family N-acetyltransferase [Rhizobium herbae]|jgi:RimJ/RimL family protein N-acetyltransferase
MAEAARYSVVEALRDGRRVEIRALRPEDRGGFAEAAGRSSPESLRRRFFAPRSSFTEQEITFFVDVDFVNHVALVAVADEGDHAAIIGSGRYILLEPGQAEVALTVADQYQGQGLGGQLVRHLTTIARQSGIRELIAEVLPENAPMLTVFKKTGLRLSTKRERGVVHVTLHLS